MTISFLVIMGNALWVAKQQAERQKANPPVEAKELSKADGEGEVAPPEQPADANDAGAGKAAPVDPEAPVPDAPAEQATLDAAPADEDPAIEIVTLGSADPDSNYRMLVTLTNQGAGVRRIELASPRYTDLHDRNGYLGHLELQDDGGEGPVVRAVGPGTPADKAGLLVGDRLLRGGVKTVKPIANQPALTSILSTTRPNQKLNLVVSRDGQEVPLSAALRRRPLEVIRPESENVRLYEKDRRKRVVEPPSFLLTLDEIDERKLAGNGRELRDVRLLDSVWRITAKSEDSVTFERRLPELGLVATKRYRLAELADADAENANARGYHLLLDVTMSSLGADAGGQNRRIAYRLDGPNGLPIEGWWYATKVGREWGAAGLRDVIGRYLNRPPVQQGAAQIAGGDGENFDGEAMAYMGVDGQYFSAALIPQVDNPTASWISGARPILIGEAPKEKANWRLANVSFRVVTSPFAVDVGKTVTHSYEVFVGPKRPNLLAQYSSPANRAYSLNDFVYYGWFGSVAQVMVAILHGFYALVRNYGIAIIMLTVLVRACMFPISRKQVRSMAKLQELRPEMERIKEKYKGDQQKQAQAMQELYRKHNVNPLAGCLPALIQLPIFLGLWRALAVDVELRQAPLFGQAVRWCSNLAAPDMFWNWSGIMPNFINEAQGFFGLGPYLNLLPLATIGLFLWQQKMFTPPPANEQAEMQMKIMKIMMIVMSIFFYKVPSGLCLYLIVSSLWGISERLLFPPPTPAAASASPPTAARKPADRPAERRSAKNGDMTDKRGARNKRKR